MRMEGGMNDKRVRGGEKEKDGEEGRCSEANQKQREYRKHIPTKCSGHEAVSPLQTQIMTNDYNCLQSSSLFVAIYPKIQDEIICTPLLSMTG